MTVVKIFIHRPLHNGSYLESNLTHHFVNCLIEHMTSIPADSLNHVGLKFAWMS